MKRSDLADLNLTPEALDKIMSLHGADVVGLKQQVSELEGKLTTATESLDKFKGVDVAKLQSDLATAKEDLKAASKQKEVEIAAIRKEHQIDAILGGYKFTSSFAQKGVRDLVMSSEIKFEQNDKFGEEIKKLIDEKIMKETPDAFIVEQPKGGQGGSPRFTSQVSGKNTSQTDGEVLATIFKDNKYYKG